MIFKSYFLQVGAAVGALCEPKKKIERSLCNPDVHCASIKSNMGHMEPSAASAGLAALVVIPLLALSVAVNAKLRQWGSFVGASTQMHISTG